MSSSSLRVGLAQFDIAWEDRQANILNLQSLMQFEDYVDLLLLPEMWSTGFTNNPQSQAEHSPGPALNWMIEQSNKLDTVIAGSIAVEDNGKYYNRFYCAYPNGDVLSYDKRHLFSYGKEDLNFSGGDSRLIFEVKGWKIMPIICYDLRFSAWCRNNNGYDLIVVVANWPTP